MGKKAKASEKIAFTQAAILFGAIGFKGTQDILNRVTIFYLSKKNKRTRQRDTPKQTFFSRVSFMY